VGYIAIIEPKLNLETIMFTQTDNTYIRTSYPSDAFDTQTFTFPVGLFSTIPNMIVLISSFDVK